jgi:choline dehydrogenase-like flavoprotein
MIIDLASSASVAPRHAGVCIAGAGAAGICLALELAKSGINVTLLEGGGLEEESSSQDLYASAISGIPHRGIHEGRMRVFGGSTTRWAGQILELDASNFERRPWVPHSGWPFSQEALLPHYRRATELEGLTSVMPEDTSVWQSIHCAPPDFGDQLVPFFSRFCPEPNFVRLHRKTLCGSGKINVYLHANLCEIELAEGQESIVGLGCRTLAGDRVTFTADHYVLCLGGIEVARILLQPLPRGRMAPWNACGLVGRYFQDHIDVTVLEIKPHQRRFADRWFEDVYRGPFKYRPYLKLSAREQERLECLAISAGLSLESEMIEEQQDFKWAAKQVLHGHVGAIHREHAHRFPYLAGLMLRKAAHRVLHGRGYTDSDGRIFLRFHCEQSPNPDSRIELTPERDATGLFRSRLHWAVTDQEVHTMGQFANVICHAFRRSGFADVIVNPVLQEGGPALIDRFEDTFHHMGATRMADSPQRGVVDANLKLFGVHNGYVCSSSVFPTSGFSNPTHTIIALAMRLAEHLAAGARHASAVIGVSSTAG